MSVLAAVGRAAAIAAAAVRGWTQGWRGAEPPPDDEPRGTPWTAVEEQRRQIRDATTLYKVPPSSADPAHDLPELTAEATRRSKHCPNCGTLAADCREARAYGRAFCCELCVCAGRK